MTPPSSNVDVSRRDFVRLAGAALAVPALAGCATTSAPAGASAVGGKAPTQPHPTVAGKPVSGTIRIGVIGCGGRGTGAAIQVLRADPNTVLVAMSDVFQDRLDSCYKAIMGEMGDQAAARVQVPPERRHVGFDAYQRVVDSDVDVVLLTSYPAFRPAHYAAAVASGKHVFAEKPVAVDGPGLRSVLDSAAIARQKGLATLVGFCWRYNDGMRAAFDQINAGALGPILSVHTTYYTSTLQKRPRRPAWTDVEFMMRNWWHFTWISGDHIVEQAVHSVDRLAWATGDRIPERVICLGGRAARSGPEHGNVYDHFSAVYEYADGTRAFHSCRQIDGTPSDNTDYVYGAKGSAVINGWVPTYSIKDLASKESWKYTGPTDRDMYQNEHNELFASIRRGQPINDAQRGAHSTLMAIMARMAAYTGQTITWEQAMQSKESLVPGRLELGPMPTPEVAIPGKTKFI